jgi:2-keto-4-pentenoate hydratase/2-oxohepta-3-ene-1,7-dioic acid hydratase in catechol pathway
MLTGRVVHDGEIVEVVASDDGLHAFDPARPDRPGARLDADAVRHLVPVTPTTVVGVIPGIRHPELADSPDLSPHFRRIMVSELPHFFHKGLAALTAPGDPIVYPPDADDVMAEGEVGVVIGRTCSRVSPADAWDHVRGITIVNDVTAPAFIAEEDDLFRGKSQPGFCPMGPWVRWDVAESAIRSGLTITTHVNGAVACVGSTADLSFAPSVCVSRASWWTTLHEGDVVHLGSPKQARIRPGDVVAIEVDGLGVLENPVVAA